MKPKRILIVIFACVTFCFIPRILPATEVIGNWVAEPWQPEDMISWGSDNVLVDFGSNGLWRYDGSWIRISHWNPKRMITWSDSKLIVDFGQNGLYCYDGEDWKKIAIPKQ
jgi:hypothetical protein